MRLLRKFLIGVLAAGGVLAAIALGFAWLFTRGQKESVIVEFHPTQFAASATHAFFYSLGDELKSSNSLDPHSPTLYSGSISAFQVSPDGDKIAIVSKGELLIVGQSGAVLHVAPVDSIYRDKPPMGQEFFRNQQFQWSEDSENLFLVRDKFYPSVGSQLFSKFGELWKYNLLSQSKTLVLKPFPAADYFFGKSGIYFSIPTSIGDLQLRYFGGKQPVDVGDSTIPHPTDSIPDLPDNDIFYSFGDYDYSRASEPPVRVRIATDDVLQTESYEANGRVLFKVKQGVGIKGPYYCGDSGRTRYAPGYRYALLDEEYCGGYSGDVLVDLETGLYKALPAGTRLFVTVNTSTYHSFRVTGGGIVP